VNKQHRQFLFLCPTLRMSFNRRPYQTPITPAYIPRYVPACCPPEANSNPKRNTPYCPTTPSRSEPLSHHEYLVKRRQANWAPLSSAAALTQVGAGVTTQNGRIGYATTIWTETRNTGACCYGGTVPAIPVPAVNPGGHAIGEGVRVKAAGDLAGRGTLSVYDTKNHIESITTQRRAGYGIASDTTNCTVCQLPGTNALLKVGNPQCACGTPTVPNY
jgi:hypothetical protein